MKYKTSSLLQIVALILVISSPALPAQGRDIVSLQSGWKFMTGDNLEYAAPGFDDSRWQPIRVDESWDPQGFEKLDGFAWYRIKVVIPSSLKAAAHLKDGLRVFLGKINNFDQSFLNGRLIGMNGSAAAGNEPLNDAFTKADNNTYEKDRIYVLPVDDPRILWDKENVIAVRVFDAGGLGGMYSGDGGLRMVALPDYLATDSAARPFVFNGRQASKSFMVHNTSSVHTLTGEFIMRATDKLTGQEVFHNASAVELKPLAAREFAIGLNSADQPTEVACEFTFAPTGEKMSWKEEAPYVLTPAPPEAPRINGATVAGVRPGHPFLYAIAATGKRPMTFEARGLPAGLDIDPRTGYISGRTGVPGKSKVVISAKNALGKTERGLTISVGNTIALTPPMGWNSWNCWGESVTADRVLASARVFEEKGLRNHGWAYINVDDGWEIFGDSPSPKRKPNGDIITNEKFPDMKSLGDRLHALGLKFGIYSSPGPLTCGGYTASHGFEMNDARSYAHWGIDYLKYDWCSYEQVAKDSSRAELMKPYTLMRRCLDKAERDIVYSLCQYGMGKVWEWGDKVGGNLWRTTEDITDTWESLKTIGFSQVENAPFAGPGHWNDPDMLVVGWVGWGPSLHPSRLTPDEQYTHISLWCLLSAPLLIGCDLERLDDFTLNLLTNDEVLAIDQDPLGKQAVPIARDGDIQVWVKELADGGRAVGVFNLGPGPSGYELDPGKIGFPAPAGIKVRDLWKQKDLGDFGGKFAVRVPSHGVALIKIAK